MLCSFQLIRHLLIGDKGLKGYVRLSQQLSAGPRMLDYGELAIA
jgi:hypothetical protein